MPYAECLKKYDHPPEVYLPLEGGQAQVMGLFTTPSNLVFENKLSAKISGRCCC